jgi:RimJ/RimL family protein N-acetyltransferase
VDVYLETERLVLRRFTADDGPLLVELDGDPEVTRYINGGQATPAETVRDVVLPRLLGHYQNWTGYGVFAAHEKDGGEFVGWFALRPERSDPDGDPELGYRLRRAAWGLGYATEGSKALVRQAFAVLGARRVWAQTMTVNRGSRNVMEKSGLTYVRTFFPDLEPIEGSEEGDVEYEITREAWKARGAGEAEA